MVSPVMTRLNELDVIEARKLLNPSPATFCNDSLISVIPYKKSPRDPAKLRICNTVFIILKLRYKDALFFAFYKQKVGMIFSYRPFTVSLPVTYAMG